MPIRPKLPMEFAAANLSDSSVRESLTPVAIKAVLRIADAWGLSEFDLGKLLGKSERTVYRYRENPVRTLSQDELTRISALIGIFKGLRLLLSEPLVYEWPTLPNSNPLFGNERPVDAMIRGGIPTMLRVRGYIDAIRGGS